MYRYYTQLLRGSYLFSFIAVKIVIFYSVFRHWPLIEVIPTASKLHSDMYFHCDFNTSCIKQVYQKKKDYMYNAF
jgi:hypothetical protein